MDYQPTGVCSRLVHVELDGGKIANVEFVGGCAGNTSGISSLVKGSKHTTAVPCSVMQIP